MKKIYILNTTEEQIKSLSASDTRKFNFLISNGHTKDEEEALKSLDSVIIHKDTTVAEVVEISVRNSNEFQNLSECLQYNIDFGGVANDLEHCGFFIQEEDDVFEYVGHRRSIGYSF